MAFKRIKDWATSITAFRTGDVIPVDGPSGTAKMSKDDLLKETAQNALVGGVAPAFDPTRDEDHKYLAGESVSYEGKTYTFKVDHYGAWAAADVREYCITDSIDNINDDLLGTTKNVQIGYSTATGYYYHASIGNSIASAIVESSGKYTPFVSSLNPVGIDITAYVGRVLRITMTDRNSGIRNSAITDSDGIVIEVIDDSDYSSNGDGTKTASVQVPVDSKYLFWSSHTDADLLSLEVSISGFGVEPRIEKIESEIPFTRSLEMTTTYVNVSIDGEGIACGFTKSMSTKVSGIGGGIVEIDIPERNYECGSIGIYFPWESQKAIQIYYYYDNDSQGALFRANYKSAATGWVFYQQGHGFMRISFPKGTKKIKLRIDATDHESDPWEFYVADNFIFNDDYPLTPICVMYDGGKWAGKVIDNGVEMSLWQLHHKYNIPYGIGVQLDNITDLNPEVAADIASGFAHIILRSQPLVPYYNDSDDTQITEVLRQAFTDINADSRMLVLAEHKLDEKIYRVAKQGNVDIVRTGASNNLKSSVGQKYGDSDLFCVPSSRLGGGAGDYMLNYPVILWEHGVGIPPQDWTGLAYVDQTGENTPLLFQWLHGLMEQGKALCLSPSDFVAYCKSH